MKIVAVLPARLASSRLANKVLLDICGKPMIQHVYQAIQSIKEIDEVYIATDSDKIKKIANSFHAKVIMTRPDHTCGTDRIIEASEHFDADFILNIQADEPLIKPKHIQPIIKFLKENDISILTPYVSNNDISDFMDENKVKLVLSKSGSVFYFSRQGIPYTRGAQSGFSGTFNQHVGIYAFRSKVLKSIKYMEPSKVEKLEKLEQLRWLENGIPIHAVEIPKGLIGVDTQQDLERVRKRLKAK